MLMSCSKSPMAERPRYPKMNCCIGGCTRWSRLFAPGSEWICGHHWRLIRPSRRRALRKLWKWLDSIDKGPDGQYVEPVHKDWEARRLYKMRRWKAANLWKGAVKEATLRAAGL